MTDISSLEWTKTGHLLALSSTTWFILHVDWFLVVS